MGKRVIWSQWIGVVPSKALKALALLACLAIAVPATASTITYEYTTTSTDSGPGAGITYTLVINDETGAATFSIDGGSNAGEIWQAGWFTFKFQGSTTSNLSDLTSPALTGPWSIADVNENTAVKVLTGGTYNKLLNGGSSGFYVESLAFGGAPANPTEGVCLTSVYCTSDLPATFEFTIALPQNWSMDAISFQVGYYDGVTQNFKYITNQLSEILVEDIPDTGATLGLLGLAMLCLGYIRWREH